MPRPKNTGSHVQPAPPPSAAGGTLACGPGLVPEAPQTQSRLRREGRKTLGWPGGAGVHWCHPAVTMVVKAGWSTVAPETLGEKGELPPGLRPPHAQDEGAGRPPSPAGPQTGPTRKAPTPGGRAVCVTSPRPGSCQPLTPSSQ